MQVQVQTPPETSERPYTGSEMYTARPSTYAYLEYRKRMQDRLQRLNDNMSSMIQDSIHGIDTICNKVRYCLGEMESNEATFNLHKHHPDPEPDPEPEQDIEPEEPETFELVELEHPQTEPKTNIEDYITKIEESSKQVEQVESSLTSIVHKLECIVHKNTKIKERDKASYKKAKSEWLQKQANFMQKFKDSIESIEEFDKIMNRIVEDVNSKIQNFAFPIIHEKEPKPEPKIEAFYITQAKKDHPKPTPSLASVDSTSLISASKDISDPVSKYDEIIKFCKVEPDVYRKRGVPNLFKKLKSQVEATDSFAVFQKLMSRRKLYQNKRRNSTKLKPEAEQKNPKREKKGKEKDLVDKFSDSLWFSPQAIKKRNAKAERRKSLRNSRGKSLERIQKSTPKLQIPRFHPQVYNNQPLSPSQKCRLQWMKAKLQQCSKRSLNFCDILDDLSFRDLEPLKAEYPRRDGVLNEGNKKVNDTYLYKLMFGKQEDAWKHLLGAKSSHGQTIGEAIELETNSRPTSPKQGAVYKRLLPYILDPVTDSMNQTLTVMPVRITYNCQNEETKKSRREKRDKKPDKEKGTKGIPRSTTVHNLLASQEKKVRRTFPSPQKLEIKQAVLPSNQYPSLLQVPGEYYPLLEQPERDTSSRPKASPKPQLSPRGKKPLDNKKSSGCKSRNEHNATTFSRKSSRAPEDIKSSASAAAVRKKMMLMHLQGLKGKNDKIQSNIQKAIDVIEMKMVDILSSQVEDPQGDAFDAMEKEINNVLLLMKAKQEKSIPVIEQNSISSPGKNPQETRDEINTISDQLFKRLQDILDSETASSNQIETVIEAKDACSEIGEEDVFKDVRETSVETLSASATAETQAEETVSKDIDVQMEKLSTIDEQSGQDCSDYVDKVSKVIQHVEDVYLKLEAVDSAEAEVEIESKEPYATPFMQALQELRSTEKLSTKEDVLEKSPSFLNIINLLDNLTSITEDTPIEAYDTRLENAVSESSGSSMSMTSLNSEASLLSFNWSRFKNDLYKSPEGISSSINLRNLRSLDLDGIPIKIFCDKFVDDEDEFDSLVPDSSNEASKSSSAQVVRSMLTIREGISELKLSLPKDRRTCLNAISQAVFLIRGFLETPRRAFMENRLKLNLKRADRKIKKLDKLRNDAIKEQHAVVLTTFYGLFFLFLASMVLFSCRCDC